MEKTKKISAAAIVSFFASLILCFLLVGAIIIYRGNFQTWYSSPEDIALIIAGLLLSLLFSLSMQNNAEIKQMRAYFDNMAITDPLTYVRNRRYFDENINRLIESVSRSGGVLTMMMVDLDYFRKYNDTYGYSKGDNCLKIVANVLSQSIKKNNDFVVRYGGKEFLVILPNTDENGARLIAGRLLKNIKDCNIRHEKSDVANCVTISIGAASGGGNNTRSGDDYINKADEALRLSRQNGYDRYTVLSL